MDPRSSVRKGDPLALAAEQVNWINRQMRGNSGFGGSAIDFSGAPYTWVYATQSAVTVVPRWGVMKIAGVEVVPTNDDEDSETQQFCSMPVLNLHDIDAGESSTQKWCVALEPIPANSIGRVAIAGVVQVKKADLHKLEDAFVFWEDDSWALVAHGSAQLKLCKTTEAWDYGTSATLDVWHDGTPPAEESSGETVEAINKIAAVPADTFVLVGKAENRAWYLVEIGRDCEDGLRAARLTEAHLDDSIASTPLGTGAGPQVLVHDEGCLRWASLEKVTVLTAVSLAESGLIFDRAEIWTFPDANSSIENTEIETTDCPPPEPPPE